jgi:mono/diheme cytochrome c family protein
MEQVKSKKARARIGFYFLLVTVAVLFPATGTGCRQKMAEQPYYRPLEGSEFFEKDNRASRPLERGVIHRAQPLEVAPLVTGLTREEWARAYAEQVNPKVDTGKAPIEDRTRAVGEPRYDPPGFDPAKFRGGQPHPGPQIYVSEFPFEIKAEDLRRGEERYTIYCAVCHGPLGNGQGKIWERGYLTPTSFHTHVVDKKREVDLTGPDKAPRDLPHGYSRGYSLWGILIPMTEVPIGYYFEVMTKGYGGMPSYSAQIPPADRWRIIAYIRVLQLSQQNVDASKLPDDVKAKLNAEKTAEKNAEKHGGGKP